jgi:PAS domain S-box-containing protein
MSQFATDPLRSWEQAVGKAALLDTAIPTTDARVTESLVHPLNHHQGGHIVQFYTDDGLLLDVLARFIGGAIAVGDASVVLATQAHHEGLAQRLKARGIDTAKAAGSGRYLALDAHETLAKVTVNGSLDEARFLDIISDILTRAGHAAECKESPLAVFGELVALLWAEGKPQAAIRVEQLWNDLAKTYNFSLLCAYPITGFKQETQLEPFIKICEQHSSTIPIEGYLGLSSVEERVRTIAELTNKVQVLENERALRESEARFRLLVEAVQDYAIFALDTGGYITSWNIGAERIKGYKASEIIGKHFSVFYREEDVKNRKPDWELQVASSEGRFEEEGWRLRKDGSQFWANVIITAIRDSTGKLIGFGKVTRDFTERMRAQRKLEQLNAELRKEIVQRKETELRLSGSEKSLRQLSRHLLRSQDEERRRIGRDLHDSLGQYLAVLNMKLDSLASRHQQQEDETAREIRECIGLTEDSIKEVRTISHLMYPPMLEELGLKSAISWYLDGFTSRSRIKTSFDIAIDFPRLPRDAELALFRVLQESLTNVHRHSGSETAHVRLLIKDEMAILEVSDRGKGIATGLLEESGQDWTGALGVGLRGMNERMRQLGGKLDLLSKEEGTTVCATIPIAKASSLSNSA